MEDIHVFIILIGIVVLLLSIICFFNLCFNVNKIHRLLKEQTETNSKILEQLNSLNKRNL